MAVEAAAAVAAAVADDERAGEGCAAWDRAGTAVGATAIRDPPYSGLTSLPTYQTTATQHIQPCKALLLLLTQLSHPLAGHNHSSCGLLGHQRSSFGQTVM